jgi:hypothetical protein
LNTRLASQLAHQGIGSAKTEGHDQGGPMTGNPIAIFDVAARHARTIEVCVDRHHLVGAGEQRWRHFEAKRSRLITRSNLFL